MVNVSVFNLTRPGIGLLHSERTLYATEAASIIYRYLYYWNKYYELKGY